MKRNRLLNSSPYRKLLAGEKPRRRKRWNLLILSLLGLIGISLTTMVLAISKPAKSTHSQVVALPNLPAEMQALPNTAKAKQLKPAKAQPQASTQLSKTAAAPVNPSSVMPSTESAEIIDSVAVEKAQLEQMHLDQHKATVTKLANAKLATAQKTSLVWHSVKVKAGDNLSLIFPRVGLAARDVSKITKLGKAIRPLLNLKPGQSLHFGINENNGKQLQLLELKLSPTETLKVAAHAGHFTAKKVVRKTTKKQVSASAEIDNSLFFDGHQAGLSDKIIMKLAHIFGWDIDFALNLRKGDRFKVIYQQQYLDGIKVHEGNILAAEFTNQGKTFRAIRFTDKKGNSHYYTPNGNSMRKAFRRTPVHFTRISSKFNPKRKHPILKTTRPHNGVDYAAPIGTPIIATGNGKVAFIGRKGGYGRVIILSHGRTYSTLYGHMSAFRKGLKHGQKVKQGQTIGYVGMSGLATGPHLHYEFRINGVYHNPLTVTLPKARSLSARYLAAFKQKARPLLARMDKVKTPTHLAMNQ